MKNDKQTEDKKLIGQVMKLSELIEYQGRSVVSRTLIDKKTGTVTIFAFDEGEGLSEHTAPYDALVHIIDGEAEIAISGRSTCLKEGEAIIMPANASHALRALKKFKMLLIMVKS